MLLFENIALAFSGLLANKMRALLTMLGIIIGIGSVIAVMTVGNSMSNMMTESMQSMGANNITVGLTQKGDEDFTEGGMTRMFRTSVYKETDLMTPDMIAQYREAYADDIYAIGIGERMGEFEAAVEGQKDTGPVSVMGVNNEYDKIDAPTMLQGRWLSEDDETKKRVAAVVSNAFCEALFGSADPLGKTFTIPYGSKIYTFYVAGVYEYEENGMLMMQSGTTPTTTMYIPLSVSREMRHVSDGVSSFTVMAAGNTDTTLFLEETKLFFAAFYARNHSYTVTASSMQSLVESLQSMMGTVSLAISVIAGISLLVGGIGIMNIMLVSITERTREIGTRKALGATNGSIRLQFIVESILICAIGGVLGILVGLGLGSMGAKLLGYAAVPSPTTIVVAVLFSMAIGVFFGYYPANKAAKMDPIEALRYE